MNQHAPVFLTVDNHYNDNNNNSQNPDTSPGDLRRLVVTQTPVKIHQQTLV